jgi:polyferredoxin
MQRITGIAAPLYHLAMQQTDSTSAPATSSSNLAIPARFGRAVQRNPCVTSAIQWGAVALYLFLLFAPFLDHAPGMESFTSSNLGRFSRFMLWGFGWPFIMLSMMLFGRVWCGVFCPDGTLTELVSRHGQKRSIPRWLRWHGWPFVMLSGTTVYGQMVGVYDFPHATLLLLGLPTLAAMLTGFLYGNGKRIWCMYLCPANGVFSLLAKIAPFHFAVNQEQWKRHSGPPPRINCAPLVNIRQMKSASACHACGRCSGYINAVDLAVRAPDSEIVAAGSKATSTAEAVTLIFGVIGICTAAMQWAGNPLFLSFKSALSAWLSGFEAFALLQSDAPWWILANYPEANTVYSLLDGLTLVLFIAGSGGMLGLAVLISAWLSVRLAGDAELTWQRLTLGLIPVAGAGMFLGLSALTVSFLRGEGLDLQWMAWLQSALLAAGALFSAWIGMRLIMKRPSPRRVAALAAYMLPVALLCYIWTVRITA